MIFIVEHNGPDFSYYFATEAESKDFIASEFLKIKEETKKKYLEFREWCNSCSREEYEREYSKRHICSYFNFCDKVCESVSTVDIYTPEEFAAKMLDENLNLG